jgi:HD-GYP domain-containing protein (c-di-GMP phosphodiesterase class II)
VVRDDDALVVRGDDALVGALLRAARERWDGGGPSGLAGEAIPLPARVLAACAAFQATGATQSAIEELRRGAATRFDPAVVAAVLAETGVTGRSPS